MKLQPYPGLPAPPIEVAVEARREGHTLHLTWRLEDPQHLVALDPPAPPARRDELWQRTCFEFFLRTPDRPGYWEFNLSPAGHWNVYHFTGYRTGMTVEPTFQALPFSVDGPTVTLAVELPPTPWELAIATVIAEKTGRISYWALAHPGPQPDFHAAGAFQLSL